MTVVDVRVAAEGDVEVAGAVEAAEAVEAAPIEVVEEFGGFGGLGFLVVDELVETVAIVIEEVFLIAIFEGGGESGAELLIEVDEVGIEVVEEGLGGLQAEGNGEAAAEGFDEAWRLDEVVKLSKLGDEPAFATGPFEWGGEWWVSGLGRHDSRLEEEGEGSKC